MFDLIYRFDPDNRPCTPPPIDTAAAIRRLEDGNRQFAKLLDAAQTPEREVLVLPYTADDFGLPTADGCPPRQKPFAAILGCSDARVPTEMIFNQACNDMFVVRVAGNVLGAECLGSLDYAVTNLGESLKLVVVLGHSGCGAVTAAVDAFREPGQYLRVATTHPLRAIVDRLFPAVRTAHWGLEQVYGSHISETPGYRAALIETSVAVNAALTAAVIQDELSEGLGPNRAVVYGVYNLLSRRVKMTLEEEEDIAIRLAPPPAPGSGFDSMAILVAGSGLVKGLLEG